MNEVVKLVKDALDILKEAGKGRATGEVRKLSRPIYKQLSEQSIADKLVMCELLLKEENWPWVSLLTI